MGLNLSSATDKVYDLGQDNFLLEPQFPHLYNGNWSPAPRLPFWIENQMEWGHESACGRSSFGDEQGGWRG